MNYKTFGEEITQPYLLTYRHLNKLNMYFLHENDLYEHDLSFLQVWEFESIHKLNYKTFVEAITQPYLLTYRHLNKLNMYFLHE
ncbi:hypothetical protein ACT453_51070, partial [Bacillus sp. D-CC]